MQGKPVTSVQAKQQRGNREENGESCEPAPESKRNVRCEQCGADQLLERMSEVGETLSQALQCDPDGRQSYLAEACSGDPWLRQAVEAVLESERVPTENLVGGGLLSAPLLSPEGLPFLQQTAVAGSRVGGFRIVREIGSGGMGVVYLAEREDCQYQQRVALKILFRDTGGDTALRFAQERQILATLSHPAITRLLDSDVTENGQPFLVMEYVDGQPIDRYCDEHRLTVDERLRLFSCVIDAVHYAHRNLVVHRDLKPSNILVTREGHVKLLDFGIAKVLERASMPCSPPHTGTAVRVMTPEYASPEQILGHPVTTASDVYQLGLLLFELLSGCRYFSQCGRSAPERVREICEREQIVPSAAAAGTGRKTHPGNPSPPSPESIADSRRTNPQRLRRILRGDLDCIVLTALRDEPERRYPSADQLGRDIERHLSGQPIAARRDSQVYQMRKFVERHRAGVIFVLTVLFILSFHMWRLSNERDRARLEAEKALQASEFLKDLLEISSPGRIKGDEISAQELLSWGSQRVASATGVHSGVLAMMMATLGDLYRRHGMYDESEGLLAKAVAIERDSADVNTSQRAANLKSLGDLYRDTGRYEEAETLYVRALEAQHEALGPDHPDVAATLDGLAELNTVQARYREARRHYERALEIRVDALGSDHPDVASTLANVAVANAESGLVFEAEQRYGRALDITNRALGPDHPQVATILNRIAFLLRARGDYAGAEDLFRRCVAIREATLSLDHPDVAASLSNLAEHCQRLGRYQEARDLYEQALTVFEEALDPGHPKKAVVLNNLCSLGLELGHVSEAEPMCREGMAIREASLKSDHPCLAMSLNNLGRLCELQGDLDGAETHHLRALRIWERVSRREGKAARLNAVARVRVKLGKYGEAASFCNHALTEIESQRARSNGIDFGLDVVEASVLLELGQARWHLRDPDAATAAWSRALALIEPVSRSGELVVSMDIHARLLLLSGCVDEARPLVESLLALGWRGPELLKLAMAHGLVDQPA